MQLSDTGMAVVMLGDLVSAGESGCTEAKPTKQWLSSVSSSAV
jgi:hypothetical protein